MFKSLVKLAATAGVAGAIAVSPVFTLKAQALTEEKAFERLQFVPVFAIVDDKGTVLPFTLQKQANAKPEDSQVVWRFFLSPEDAQTELRESQKQLGPEIGKKITVSVGSLGEVLKNMSQYKDKKIVVDFVPAKANLEAAKVVLNANGAKANAVIPPIPVFFLAQGDKGEAAVLSYDVNQNGKIEQGESQLPVFIDKSDLQEFLDQMNKLNPTAFKNTKVQVVSLLDVLGSMISKDNKPNVGSEIIRFVPSRISQEYIVKNAKQSATPPSAPQVAPARKAPANTAKPTPKK